MDIPTDCPQRERRGWLGDAQLSFETVIHNIDGGGFYTKWLNDFADTQVYDNITMGSDGALPDCIPFYGHGNTDSDPGWGIAAWTITDWFSDYYADDVFDVAWYPNMKWYMNHWIKITAQTPDGIFPIFHWGDWGNNVPGPSASRPQSTLSSFTSALSRSLQNLQSVLSSPLMRSTTETLPLLHVLYTTKSFSILPRDVMPAALTCPRSWR